MRLIAGGLVALLAALGSWFWVSGAGTELAWWAAQQQRAFQNEMAGAITALRRGDQTALWTLIGACAAYGVVHAVGPGHGKVLIGGAGIASQATARRLVALAFVSSLAQAGTAILLVYGGFALFELGARQAAAFTDDWLAPVSAAAIAAIGLVLAWRGARQLWRGRRRATGREADTHTHAHGHAHAHSHSHDDACGCGHAHAPSAAAVEAMTGWRDALAIIAGIAVRPCTGAVIVLVLAWRFGVPWAGAGAAIAMGLGTAVVVMAVAAASVGARSSALLASGEGSGTARLAAPILQIAGGLFIAGMSGVLLAGTLA